MRLQELTLSGFKSFAKRTTFHFPDSITAIVGPNGSGKSNIAESIRWVLGEQSMKSLRGKRGEDLIFNGSVKAARMGKAGVELCFDNRDGAIPLDFEKVIISRKIFRDGTSDYGLNGSPARLKDIVELLARMGLGESKHNIIGQGEVDRFLSSGPMERREFLEEALGLRLWQLKKREAERKLAQTHENIHEVESLLREIRPHLKFLKLQADKADRREKLEQELENYYRAFVQTENHIIEAEAERLDGSIATKESALKTLREDINVLSREISGKKQESLGQVLDSTEEGLKRLDLRQRELERELGRIEGRQETERLKSQSEERPVQTALVKKFLDSFRQSLENVLSWENIEKIKEEIKTALALIEKFFAEISGTGKSGENAEEPQKDSEQRRQAIQQDLKAIENDRKQLEKERETRIAELKRFEANFQELWTKLRQKEEAAQNLSNELERLRFEKEKLETREGELERIIAESRMTKEELSGGQNTCPDLLPEELKKKIEKARLRLEELMGIDKAVLREYNDTQKRHDFLEKELEDLVSALKDLEKLSSELEERIEKDFKNGFLEVGREFQNYFNIIFGGGLGRLEIVKLAVPNQESESADEEAEAEYGVDINVDIPRKRIKGLAMLSGGERALVSIALLFAITAVNPPPFLVLDETDAALDEANSQKYATILKELSQKTQLILITHNRETMKQAGVLYGVTMGDDGISKILSLKLEEAASYGNR